MRYFSLKTIPRYAGHAFNGNSCLESLKLGVPTSAAFSRCYGSRATAGSNHGSREVVHMGSRDRQSPISTRGYGSQTTAAGNEEVLKRARERLSPLGEGSISLSKDGGSGIATITLQHQHRKNALSGRMMVQLMDIVSELEEWHDGRAVLLQSEGDFFCSGGDLTTVSSISNPEDGHLMCTLMQDTLTRLRCLSLVSVCLVQGRALGGGAELITATDFRLFTEAGEAGFVQGVMGVSPGWGGGTRLVQLVGARVALDLLLTARKVDAGAAFKIGLADEVVEHSAQHERAQQWLAERINFEPQVVHAMKRLVVAARDQSVEGSLQVEKGIFTPLWGGPANVRALDKKIKH